MKALRDISMKTTRCRGCGAEIRFMKTLKGNWTPVDPEPIHANDANEGDYLLTEEGELFKVLGESDQENDFGYVPHFATCPKAEKFK